MMRKAALTLRPVLPPALGVATSWYLPSASLRPPIRPMKRNLLVPFLPARVKLPRTACLVERAERAVRGRAVERVRERGGRVLDAVQLHRNRGAALRRRTDRLAERMRELECADVTEAAGGLRSRCPTLIGRRASTA